MTISITPDYFFITALPTSIWSQVLRYCQTHQNRSGLLSWYDLDALAGLTIDVRPGERDGMDNQNMLSGTFFSERYYQHTLSDVVQAVREGSLDSKVLTYPEFLSGHDTMIVFFWPDEGDVPQKRVGNNERLLQKVDELLEELVVQSTRHP